MEMQSSNRVTRGRDLVFLTIVTIVAHTDDARTEYPKLPPWCESEILLKWRTRDCHGRLDANLACIILSLNLLILILV